MYCQTNQNHEQPPQVFPNFDFQSHFSVLKISQTFPKKSLNNIGQGDQLFKILKCAWFLLALPNFGKSDGENAHFHGFMSKLIKKSLTVSNELVWVQLEDDHWFFLILN